jgi:arylsulfatase A-like enzyme
VESSNGPLRGEKSHLGEGGVRVPFAMRWPARLPAGVVDARPISALDIVPTVLGATQAPRHEYRFDGVDLLPYLVGAKRGTLPHESLFWRLTPAYAVRQGKWKLLHSYKNGPSELFDLSADVGETHDLAARYPNVVDSLTRTFRAWEAGMSEPTVGVEPKELSWRNKLRNWWRKLRSSS